MIGDDPQAEWDAYVKAEIVNVQRRAIDAMETAAREEVVAWLRAHGYTVIEPENDRGES